MSSSLNVSSELEEEVMAIQAQQNLMSKVKRVSDICWDKCMTDGVDSKLSYKQESCLNYCTERFIDSVLLLTNRFNQRLTGAGHR